MVLSLHFFLFCFHFKIIIIILIQQIIKKKSYRIFGNGQSHAQLKRGVFLNGKVLSLKSNHQLWTEKYKPKNWGELAALHDNRRYFMNDEPIPPKLLFVRRFWLFAIITLYLSIYSRSIFFVHIFFSIYT